MDIFEDMFFTTFTIEGWIPTFKDLPEINFIILRALTFISNEEKALILGFVIMKDHIHLIWKVKSGTIKEIVKSFKSFTSKAILKKIRLIDYEYLDNFVSDRKDRKYKFWKLNSGHFKIDSHSMLCQKLNYIHNNPTVGDYKVVELPQEYSLSSACAYYQQRSNFSFLSLVVA